MKLKLTDATDASEWSRWFYDSDSEMFVKFASSQLAEFVAYRVLRGFQQGFASIADNGQWCEVIPNNGHFIGFTLPESERLAIERTHSLWLRQILES